ncbi:unnamed protein product [Boreogadus saida]
MASHGVLVVPANTFSMERRADREKAQHSVRRHDKWAHSRGTVAYVLVERMRALVKPTARAESRLPSETAKREPSGAFKCLVSTERFHRRQVESSFSLMNEILDPRSGNMKISTFGAIQTVKYTLQSREKTAVELFKKEDVRYGEVDRILCKNIRSAGSTDKLQRQQNMLEKQRQQIKYGCQVSGSASLSKRQKAEEEKRARLRHAAKQRKRALETLVQAKKKNK